MGGRASPLTSVGEGAPPAEVVAGRQVGPWVLVVAQRGGARLRAVRPVRRPHRRVRRLELRPQPRRHLGVLRRHVVVLACEQMRAAECECRV